MFVSLKLTEEDGLCCGVKQCGCAFNINLNNFTTRKPIPDTDPIHGYTMEVTDYEALGRELMRNVQNLMKQS